MNVDGAVCLNFQCMYVQSWSLSFEHIDDIYLKVG